MQDFDTGMREKVCRAAKLESFSSRVSAICTEGTSLIAMAQGNVGRGPRSEKVSSQGIDDTITSLQHKMECYKKLDRRASMHLSSTTTGSSFTTPLKDLPKRFSMGNFEDYSGMLPKLELAANTVPAASRLFPEKKREGLRRGGSMRVAPVQKLSTKFERSSLDDSCKPTPPERVDSFKYLKNKDFRNVNSLRQKFEQLKDNSQTTPTSSMEDLTATASGAVTKRPEVSSNNSPKLQVTSPTKGADTQPQLGSVKTSPPTKRMRSLKVMSVDRSASPKVSPQAIEAILQSLSVPDKGSDDNSKLVGGNAAGNRLSQQLHQQLPQLDESSDEEEQLNKEMESISLTTG